MRTAPKACCGGSEKNDCTEIVGKWIPLFESVNGLVLQVAPKFWKLSVLLGLPFVVMLIIGTTHCWRSPNTVSNGYASALMIFPYGVTVS